MSTAGYNQFNIYKRLFGKTVIDTSQGGAITAKFGISLTTSISSIIILTPISKYEFHIVKASTLFLLRLAEIDTKKITLDYDSLTKVYKV